MLPSLHEDIEMYGLNLVPHRLIAIMLGRLKMDIDDCIKAYATLSARAFQKVKHRINLRGKLQGRFDEIALKNAIQDVVAEAGLDRDALLKDDPSAPCKV